MDTDEKPFETRVELLDLPNELLEQITRHLTTPEDISTLRLVSSRTHAIVDHLVGISARLPPLKHPKCRTFSSQLKFYLRSGLRTIILADTAISLPKLTFSRMLCRRNLLEGVTFEGRTTPKIVSAYLTGCWNLRNVHLYGKIDALLPTSCSYQLFHLRSLDIRLNYGDSATQTRSFTSALNTLLTLDHLTSPRLVTFCCELWSVGRISIPEVLTHLLSFLQRNGSSLRKMFVCLRYSVEGKTPSPQELGVLHKIRRRHPLYPSEAEFGAELHRIMAPLGLRIQLTSLLISITLFDDPWLSFLPGQRSLAKLGVCDDHGHTGWRPLQLVVKLNQATLVTIYVMSHFFLGDKLDFSCFSGCSSLRELLLININITTDPAIIALALGNAPAQDPLNYQHVINFAVAEFCPNLEFLATTNLSFARTELDGLLNLRRLKHLALLNAGEVAGVGVTYPLMKNLLRIRTLEGLALDGIIGWSRENLEEINGIISSLRDEQDRNVWSDLVLNIRDKNPTRRKWQREEQGFVFDIDFYQD